MSDFGSASTGPRRAFVITNAFLSRLVVARARRRVRRMPGLAADERQSLLNALSRYQAG